MIKRALSKYGKENFKKETLCVCISKEELCEKEKYYINLLRPHYNIAAGGEGGNTSLFMSEKEKKALYKRRSAISKKYFEIEGNRKKYSEMFSGEKNPAYGKRHSQESLEKMSKAQKQRYINDPTLKLKSVANFQNKPPWHKGTRGIATFTEERKEKMRGRIPWNKGMRMPDSFGLQFVGKIISPETRAKLSFANKGNKNPKYIKFSEEETSFIVENLQTRTKKDVVMLFNAKFRRNISVMPIYRVIRENKETKDGSNNNTVQEDFYWERPTVAGRN